MTLSTNHLQGLVTVLGEHGDQSVVARTGSDHLLVTLVKNSQLTLKSTLTLLTFLRYATN